MKNWFLKAKFPYGSQIGNQVMTKAIFLNTSLVAFTLLNCSGCATIPERNISFLVDEPAQEASDRIFEHAGQCLANTGRAFKDGIKVERSYVYGVAKMEVWSYAMDGVSGPHITVEIRETEEGTHILVQQPEGHGALSSKYSEEDERYWREAQMWAKGDMVCSVLE